MTPTAAERFFFDTRGYLVVDGTLSLDHIGRLRGALDRTIRRRLNDESGNPEGAGFPTHRLDNGARVFYLLDEDPELLAMIDFPGIMPYVTALLNEEPHFHASDAFWQTGPSDAGPGWHRDGTDDGFRRLSDRIPLLQLKIGYFLSDMREPDQGNLMVVPGSHHTAVEPSPEQLTGFDTLPGAVQLCVPAGSCVIFHNGLWHSRGPARKPDGERIILYFAYEHPWMAASPEPLAYPGRFYAELSESHSRLFSPVVARL